MTTNAGPSGPKRWNKRAGLLTSVLMMTHVQLRYRAASIVVALAVEIGLVVGLWFFGGHSWASDVRVVTWVTFLVGFMLGSVGLSVDTGERRVRMLVVLPVRRTAVALSRLLGAAALPALIAVCAWVLQILWLARGESILDHSRELATVWAWAVVAIYSTMFFEEVNVALNSKKWLVYPINLFFAVLVFFFALSDIRFGRLLTFWWLVAGVNLSVFLAVVSVLLFRQRETFDVGISPWHGLPVDWSKERGAQRK